MRNSNNNNLNKAKGTKNDEFYTQYEDIEKELTHYKNKFKDKVVYCNCDNPKYSNFWKYFYNNFQELHLKKLISTYFSLEGKHSYRTEFNGINLTKTKLCDNGDFRNKECVEILKEADIVITNPPFSLLRDYIAQLMKYEKHFLIIGNKNIMSYKEIFPLLKNNKFWIGYNSVNNFQQSDGTFKKFGNIGWFTNFDIDKRHESLLKKLYKKYSPDEYIKYDNYNAININKVTDIPIDYDEKMGVPITFLEKYNPDEFEILGILQSSTDEEAGTPNLRYYNDFKEMRQDMTYTGASGRKANGHPVVQGKSLKGNFLYNPTTNEFVHAVYARILICRK